MERAAERPLVGWERILYYPCRNVGGVAMCSAVTPLMPGLGAVLLWILTTGPGGMRSILLPRLPTELATLAAPVLLVVSVYALVSVGGGAAGMRAGTEGARAKILRGQALAAGACLAFVPFAPNLVFLVLFATVPILLVPLFHTFRAE